jgi:hypothetical protein
MGTWDSQYTQRRRPAGDLGFARGGRPPEAASHFQSKVGGRVSPATLFLQDVLVACWSQPSTLSSLRGRERRKACVPAPQPEGQNTCSHRKNTEQDESRTGSQEDVAPAQQGDGVR